MCACIHCAVCARTWTALCVLCFFVPFICVIFSAAPSVTFHQITPQNSFDHAHNRNEYHNIQHVLAVQISHHQVDVKIHKNKCKGREASLYGLWIITILFQKWNNKVNHPGRAPCKTLPEQACCILCNMGSFHII